MTAQYPDRIIYKGKECDLHSNPLESYFDKYPDKRPQSETDSNALWRGYIATFEIKDNQLYIRDIKIEIISNGSVLKLLKWLWKLLKNRQFYLPINNFRTLPKNKRKNYQSGWKSVIDEVFPNQELIKVDWETDTLVLPSGELVNYVHMGYASTYEYYTLLEIENGDLKSEKHIRHEEF